MPSESREIDVDVALIDIDGTITIPMRETDFAVSPLEHLLRMVMQRDSIPPAEALAKVQQAGDIETSCAFSFLAPLGLSRQAYWDALQQDIKGGIIIADDAVFFIKSLRNKHIRLFSATTNSRMATLVKLSVADLGGIDGAPYFDGFFGGDSFHDPRGKWSPDFFPSILKAGGFNPKRTLMVGDNLEQDMLPALRAGIKTVAIINRQQQEKLLCKDGVLFINSLEVLYHMLKPASEEGRPAEIDGACSSLIRCPK